MPETPDDRPDGQQQGGGDQGGASDGGQPTGGQPQGGQVRSGQAEGGQAQGGQPRGGQPAGGQPQGQAPQGQVPPGQAGQGHYQRGPGVGDIFSIPETVEEIKFGVAMYVLAGVGAGVGLLGIGAGSGNFGGLAALSGLGALSGLFALPIGIGVILAIQFGLRQDEELEDQPNDIAMATAGATAAIGSAATFLISATLAMLGIGGFFFGPVLLPLILTAVGSAITGAGVIWVNRSLLAPSPQAPPRQGAPQQGQPRQ